MHTSQDKTIVDTNRRDISFKDYPSIKETLPEYFREAFPKLISFIEAYYEFDNTTDSPARLIHELFAARDISAADLQLLSFIEDELLLGEQYFEGFTNKRSAAKFSNFLYRSKGTLYSIEQFFRMFFGIAPEVVYTKKNVFTVGESRIGTESEKYLHNDQLYQKFALLVKAELPLAAWKDAYKLFVHPAGMYLGAEVQLVAVNGIIDTYAPIARAAADANPIVIAQPVPTIAIQPTVEITGLVISSFGRDADTTVDSGDDVYRIKLPAPNIENKTIEELDRIYDTIGEATGTVSPTFDEDSAGSDFRVPRFSSVEDTFDEISLPSYNPYD